MILGLCGAFRLFVHTLALIATLLSLKVAKDKPLSSERLNDTEIETLESFQCRWMSQPILALPRVNGSYSLEPTRVDKGAGIVLMQKLLKKSADTVSTRQNL